MVLVGLLFADADWDSSGRNDRSRSVRKNEGVGLMNCYKATVRVPNPSRSGTMIVWTQIRAANPNDAKQLLEAQYGRGNMVGVPTLC